MVVAFRYITREVLTVFLVVFFIMLLVGLGGRFVGYLQDAAIGRYSADALWLLMALRIPEFVQIILPFALFLALLLTFGRLHAEQEFTVLTSGGLSPRRMLLWILSLIVPIAMIVAFLSLEITPNARAEFSRLALEQRVVSEFDAITPGTFRSFSYGTRVTYTDRVNREKRELEGVFMGELLGDRVVTVWAELGTHYRDVETGSRFLLLHDGTRYEGFPGAAGYRVVEFERLGQRIAEEKLERFVIDYADIPTSELDLNLPEAAGEWHWRIGLGLMTVISSLAGFGLARVRPRSGRFGKIVPGMAMFVSYYVLLLFLKNAIGLEGIPEYIGLWPAHLAAAGASIWLIRRSYRPA